MTGLLVALLLSNPDSAGAQSQLQGRRVTIQVKAESPAYEILSRARRVVSLEEGGARLVTYSLENSVERSALGAALVDSTNRVLDRFRASDWLPPTAVAPGAAGQIYSATRLSDGSLAITIGWQDPNGRSHNGIALLSSGGGAWKSIRVIEVEGTVGDIASGPKGLILVTTFVPARAKANRSAPLLCVIDTRGLVHAELVADASPWDPPKAARNAGESRIQMLSGGRFALFDSLAKTVSVLKVQWDRPIQYPKGNRDGVVALEFGATEDVALDLLSVASVADFPEAKEVSRDPLVQSVRVNRDGSISVVRTLLRDKSTTTFVTRYSDTGRRLESWNTKPAWGLAFWEGDALTGVVRGRDGIFLDALLFEETPKTR